MIILQATTIRIFQTKDLETTVLQTTEIRRKFLVKIQITA